MYRLYVVSPLGALARGLAAGAIGSAVQSQFLKHTARLMPATPEGVFQPPEPEQKSEMSVETVARRFAEGMMKRGPLTEAKKKKIGTSIHYAFGSAWGGLYGLARETAPGLSRPGAVALWSALVWHLSDNVLLPVFRIASWPRSYPAGVHAYALAAHLAYGAGVWASYEAMRRPFWDLVGSAVWALAARRRLRKRLPKRARPVARAIIGSLAAARGRRPVERARAAMMMA
jgi:hypothetical protein